MKNNRPKRKKIVAINNENNLLPANTRLNQIAKALEEIIQWQYPASNVLANWFRNNAKAGAKDRQEISQAIYNILRNLRLYRHYAQSGQGPNTRRLAILGLASCTDKNWLNNGLNNYEQAWLNHVSNISAASLPLSIQYSVPDWLLEQLSGIDNLDSLLAALNQPADLDIRVNTIKVNRADVLNNLAELANFSYEFGPTPYSPWGIRVLGNPSLNRLPTFKNGEIEIQDEGSQLLGALLAPKRGELIIDYCAGAGGKTLLIGAMMNSTGRLYAFDVSASRLSRAKQRIARSGLSNIIPVVIGDNDNRVKRLRAKADRVLVDAPCSGLGIMRRTPDIKWRQQPGDIQRFCDMQAEILQQASRCLKPGGRLVYATCSILPQENEHQVENFLAANDNFQLLDAASILAKRKIEIDLQDKYLRLRPDIHNTDGFFAAVLEKVK